MDGAEVLSYYEVVDSYGRVSHWTTTMSMFFRVESMYPLKNL